MPSPPSPISSGSRRVEVGQRVDERRAGAGPGLQAEVLLGVLGGVQRAPLHPAHGVEVGARHGRVVAEGDRLGDGHRRGPQRRDHGELAAHVVGGGQQLTERRAAQHERHPAGVVDPVGEVRVAAGQRRPPQRRHQVGQALGQPRRHRLGANPAGSKSDLVVGVALEQVGVVGARLGSQRGQVVRWGTGPRPACTPTGAAGPG